MGPRLPGKVCVITGGTSGLGFATTKECIKEGAAVVSITGRDQARVDKAVDEVKEEVQGVDRPYVVVGRVCDASSKSACHALADSLKADYPIIDCLFINAGTPGTSWGLPLSELNEDHVQRVFGPNVNGVLWTAQAFEGMLRSPGASVVVNTSIAAHMSRVSFLYNVTKAAADSMSRCLASELAPKGIRVNALAPGASESSFWKTTGMDEADMAATREMMTSVIPLGRYAEAEEIARAAVFLLSSDASFVTATELRVDGGHSHSM